MGRVQILTGFRSCVKKRGQIWTYLTWDPVGDLNLFNETDGLTKGVLADREITTGQLDQNTRHYP